MFIDLHLQIELFSLPPLDQIPRSEAMTQRFVAEDGAQEMQILDSLAMNVKLFTLAQERVKARAVSPILEPTQKDTLLTSFQKTAPIVASRLAPIRRIPPREASAAQRDEA
jgi:hypothetical protein